MIKFITFAEVSVLPGCKDFENPWQKRGYRPHRNYEKIHCIASGRSRYGGLHT